MNWEIGGSRWFTAIHELQTILTIPLKNKPEMLGGWGIAQPSPSHFPITTPTGPTAASSCSSPNGTDANTTIVRGNGLASLPGAVPADSAHVPPAQLIGRCVHRDSGLVSLPGKSVAAYEQVPAYQLGRRQYA